MRIFFNSRDLAYKDPFGTLVPQQNCTLHIHIPSNLKSTAVSCLFFREGDDLALEVPMTLEKTLGAYDIFQGRFSFREPGLYFYHFRIHAHTGPFRLFKQGEETNMEAGDQWQLTCVPTDFQVPQWARGANIYQIFPDRFHKSGTCDLTGKLQPYTVHEKWNEEVGWRPNEEGIVLNNDFFGGNFRGIAAKMDYIASLGTTILYLNPIGKAFSNHRYDTGDYKTPDPMLGTLADFTAMCDAAHERGIRVILDGVFNHTGSNSLYFNRQEAFSGKGAYQGPDSPFYNWYDFKEFPNVYTSWWGFPELPSVNNMEPAFIEYIATGENSVIAHWLKAGCDGFRLDVVDELPNEFVSILRKSLRALRPDALLIGEVWEDASNKIAYGVRRRYFVDGVLDSIMNYPFRTAILNYLWGRDDGNALREAVLTILENYPPQVVDCNMNMLGTHDTPRILTALVDPREGYREENAYRKLTSQQYHRAGKLLKLASVLQYCLPGSPSLYYADEAGLEGCKDPFNRRTYPWGREDPELLAHFRALGNLRRSYDALRLGKLEFLEHQGGHVSFARELEGRRILIYVNHSLNGWAIPAGKVLLESGLKNGRLTPLGFCILEEA